MTETQLDELTAAVALYTRTAYLNEPEKSRGLRGVLWTYLAEYGVLPAPETPRADATEAVSRADSPRT